MPPRLRGSSPGELGGRVGMRPPGELSLLPRNCRRDPPGVGVGTRGFRPFRAAEVQARGARAESDAGCARPVTQPGGDARPGRQGEGAGGPGAHPGPRGLGRSEVRAPRSGGRGGGRARSGGAGRRRGPGRMPSSRRRAPRARAASWGAARVAQVEAGRGWQPPRGSGSSRQAWPSAGAVRGRAGPRERGGGGRGAQGGRRPSGSPLQPPAVAEPPAVALEAPRRGGRARPGPGAARAAQPRRRLQTCKP